MIKHHMNHVKKFAKVTFKNTYFPDPCIYVRKGSGKILLGNLANPISPITTEASVFLDPKQKRSPYRKLKTQPRVKVCLW